MLLLVVGVLYALVGSRSEAVAAFVVIALMVAAEMGTEYRAKLALLHLRTSTPQEAMLLRSGLPKRVDRNLVVPGDCVILRAGMVRPRRHLPLLPSCSFPGLTLAGGPCRHSPPGGCGAAGG